MQPAYVNEKKDATFRLRKKIQSLRDDPDELQRFQNKIIAIPKIIKPNDKCIENLDTARYKPEIQKVFIFIFIFCI